MSEIEARITGVAGKPGASRLKCHRAFALTKIRNENIAHFFKKIGLKCTYIWY
jgi:hypothetical protein